MSPYELAESLVEVRVADYSGPVSIRFALWLRGEAGKPAEWLAQTYDERSANNSLRKACVAHVASLLERGAKAALAGELELPSADEPVPERLPRKVAGAYSAGSGV